MMNKPIPLNIKDENLKELLEIILSTPRLVISAPGIDIEELKRVAQQPGRVIAPEPVIKHLKVKKDIPTVIEYQGRRYVLDHANNRK